MALRMPRIEHDDAQSMDIRASDRIIAAEDRLRGLMDAFPGPDRELLHQIALFTAPHVMRRIIFFNEIYKRILDVNGALMEFGVRYGRDLATLDALRSIYEPLNYARKIVGFDTFTGFPSVDAKDGEYGLVQVGGLATGESHDESLTDVLATREQMVPFEHLRKFEIAKGDASATLAAYLDANPHTIVAFAYFDFDIYTPTRDCLELLADRVTKGSILAFDELNCPDFPGETLALKEVFGLSRYAIKRFPMINPGMPSYLVIE